jgi:hypothetical protein
MMIRVLACAGLSTPIDVRHNGESGFEDGSSIFGAGEFSIPSDAIR